MKKSNKRTYIIIGSVVLVALIVLAVVKRNNKELPRVATEKSELRTIIETVTANGKIQPETDVKISPYISGEIMELLVKEGDIVTQGQLLAKIDPEIYKSTLQQNEAQLNGQRANLANSRAMLAQVQARLSNAETNFNRQKKLWEQKVISDADYETAKTNFDVAKADLEAGKQNVKASEFSVTSLEAVLRKANEDFRKTAVYAPADGKISQLSVEKGERVTGASQFSAGTELMRIANLNSMEARVEVNENDIVRVKMGDTCLIEVDAYLNRKFRGIVTQIATAAKSALGSSVDQVTNFEVRIHIDKESYKDLIPENRPDFSPFRPGMSTSVDIQTRTVKNVIAVPIQAVTTREDTTGKRIHRPKNNDESAGNDNDEAKNKPSAQSFKEYVFVYDNGTVKLREVKTGIQDNSWIEVVSGLESGLEVVSAPYLAISKDLKNSDKVEKVEKEKLFEKEK